MSAEIPTTPLVKWRFMFEKRDLWVGVFWDRRDRRVDGTFDSLHIYVCLIPTLVWHGRFNIRKARGGILRPAFAEENTND